MNSTGRASISLGGVELGDDVEIGANAVIDRAPSGPPVSAAEPRSTDPGAGRPMSSGGDCLLCGPWSGSPASRIGNRVVLGGQVGFPTISLWAMT